MSDQTLLGKMINDKRKGGSWSLNSFIMKDLELPLPNHGHVVLAKPSPVLMYQISTHDTRVLVDIPGKLPSTSNGDLKKYMQDIVAPELPDAIRVKHTKNIYIIN